MTVERIWQPWQSVIPDAAVVENKARQILNLFAASGAPIIWFRLINSDTLDKVIPLVVQGRAGEWSLAEWSLTEPPEVFIVCGDLVFPVLNPRTDEIEGSLLLHVNACEIVCNGRAGSSRTIGARLTIDFHHTDTIYFSCWREWQPVCLAYHLPRHLA